MQRKRRTVQLFDGQTGKFKVRLLFTAVLLSCLFAGTVSAAQVSVRFGITVNGKYNNSYKKWNTKVEKESWITLPSYGSDDSYLWEGKMKGEEVRFACGTRHKITENVDFSLHRTGACSVRFFAMSGSEYKKLTQKTPAMTAITLPSVKNAEDLRFRGWSAVRGTSNKCYAGGTRITISEDTVFYAVFNRKKTLHDAVYLYYNDGTLFKRLERKKGESLTFPSPYLGESKVLLGWSTRKNKKNSPEYVEDAVIPSGKHAFYMVVSDRNGEPRFRSNMLRSPRKYNQIYFLGDSRIAYARTQFGGTPEKVNFIASAGSGYKWLTGNDPTRSDGAWKRLLKQLQSQKKAGELTGRRAVIAEFGVNDLYNIQLYISYYQKMAAYLRQYRCDLYVMSVNPISRGSLEHQLVAATGTNRNSRSMPKILSFNKQLRAGAGKSYRYIDTCSYLMKTGWNSYNPYMRVGDGLHYSAYTGAKMINYAIIAAESCY